MQNTNVAITSDNKVHLSPETVIEAREVAFKHGWPNVNSIESAMSVDVYEMFREFLRQHGDSDLPSTQSVAYLDIVAVRLDELKDKFNQLMKG